MDNLLANQELQLARFGEFLLGERFVREGRERYYVLWVRKFMARSIEVPVQPLEERMACYLC